MKLKSIRLVFAACLLVFSHAASAGATYGPMVELIYSVLGLPKTYTLYIHGRNETTHAYKGDYTRYDYWGPASGAAGLIPKAVNYDGRARIADANIMVRRALDCFCTGANWCNIAAHSAGNLHLGYALADYGNTQRFISNGLLSTTGDGSCEKSAGGSTQTGWNIRYVGVAAGAAGGSELATLGQVFSGLDIDRDLVVSTARGMYDHNTTRGKTFNLFVGAKGTFYSDPLIKGHSDGAVGYHSSGGMREHRRFCNEDALPDEITPARCYELPMGSAGHGDAGAKWNGHFLKFRDNDFQYTHLQNQGLDFSNWGGAISKMMEDLRLQ
jgi:hypothetical protein